MLDDHHLRRALKGKCVLAAVFFLSWFSCRAQSNVYAYGVYGGGTTYTPLCVLKLPYVPDHFQLTQISWREDTNGLTIIDIYGTNTASRVRRESLEVECGRERFRLASDSLRAEKFKSYDGLLLTKNSGDLVQVVKQRVVDRGGRATTNALPTLKATCGLYSRTNLDVIVMSGDQFAKVQEFLEKAYGKADGRIQSPTGPNSTTLTYTPEQIGVLLNLTGNAYQTVVSIIGEPKE